MRTPADQPRRDTLIDPQARQGERLSAALTDPVAGICTAWATNADIVGYTPAGDTTDYSSWLLEASQILYILSGRQFPGVCSRTVRPIRGTCRHWEQVLSRGHIVPTWDWEIGGWSSGAYINYGCGMRQAVRLAGNVLAINQVRISGVVVDEATYRVDRGEYLVRLTDPVTGQNPGWPACQHLSLPDDAQGTFAVDYQWGHMPPESGVRAAATLAWQLYLADNPNRGNCKLPAGWTTIARQGVTVTRPSPESLPTQGTGLVGIDTFLRTVNPNNLDRPPAVYSPDVPPYAPRVGL